MVYEPLHHKYRPQTFGDLVGQDAIAKTLINAILSRKIAPAYLFTGPRGTGKTSSARILSKSLNCLASEVPTPHPCGQCEVCRAIANGSALDVIEIDAASNTGVDNIREIIERSQFAPVQCRYKVYVIDECLTGDTLVLTRDGLLRIDDPSIQGKQVLSYNESSQIWEYKQVLRWIERENKLTLTIKTKEREIRCTDNHLIRTEQGWIKAKNVKEGMKILSPVNADVEKWITNLEQVESVTASQLEKVYDIEVADNHNFVANGLLVHNCHMLSTAAFNALLKTLEEPPDRVIFVLATTDPQRVLPTIISRCQRFDYRRIPLQDMVDHLSKIAHLEEIEIDPEAVTLISQIANGGLRDAESLLDQLSLLTGTITSEKVWELVGAVPERDLLTLLQAIHSNHPETIIDQCRHLMNRGREPLVVLQNLASFYLNLLIAKTASHRPDMVAVTAPTWKDLCTEALQWDLNEILRGQQYLKDSESQLKNTTQPRLWLEVTLLSLLPIQPVTKTSIPVATPHPVAATPVVTALSIPETTPPVQSAKSEPVPTQTEEAEPISTPQDLNLEQIWQQVLRVVQPMIHSLLKEHGVLLSLENSVADVSIASEGLLKVARLRITNIEEAFAKVCGQPVKVNVKLISSNQTKIAESSTPSIPQKTTESVNPISVSQNGTSALQSKPKIEKPPVTSVPKPNSTVVETEKQDLPQLKDLGNSNTEIQSVAENLAKFFEGEIVEMNSKVTKDEDTDGDGAYKVRPQVAHTAPQLVAHREMSVEETKNENPTTETINKPSNQSPILGRPKIINIEDDEDIDFLWSKQRKIVGYDNLNDPWEVQPNPITKGLQGIWT